MTGALLTVVKSREVSIEFINDKFLKCKQQCVMTIIYGGLECNIHFADTIHIHEKGNCAKERVC